MHRAKFLVLAAVALSSSSILGQGPTVTVFEGARIIVGDGRAPLENATFIVSGNRFTQVARAADARVPAGAARVNLAGKTVMPTIIDTHTHLSQTRPMLLDDLKRRAYYGVSAALSLGQDTTDVSFQVRAETSAGKIPGAARFFTAGRGITGPEPGRTMAPHWVTTVAEARQAVRKEAAQKVDIIKFWVDDRMGTVKKLPPELILRSSTKRTRTACGPFHTSTRSRTRKARCAPGSTPSRTASATRTSTTSSWRS